MCGLKAWVNKKSALVPAKKPTQFMTNSRALGRELTRRCQGAHKHQSLVDGRATQAARYPNELCRAICRGIVKEREERDRGIRAVVEVGEEPVRRKLDLEEHHDREEAEIHIIPLMKLTQVSKNRSDVSEALAWDDLTGMKLNADKVIEARGK